MVYVKKVKGGGKNKKIYGKRCVTGRKVVCKPGTGKPPSSSTPKGAKWFGTAPICRGKCPKGWQLLKRSKRGNGKKCLTGKKVLCKPKPKPSGSTSGSKPKYVQKWYGTAPFCRGKCPRGWKKLKSSKRGSGKRCATGRKVLCRKRVN